MTQHPASAALAARAARVLPGGNSRLTVWQPPHPLYAAHGAGKVLTDADGVTRLDFTGNYMSLIHGHAHPAVVAAIAEQAARGTAFPMPTEAEVELAELLVERLDAAERVRFCNSGTEAVMIAIKAARAFTRRPMIAKVEGAYHGGYDPVEVSYEAPPETWTEDDPASLPYVPGTPRGTLEEVAVLPFNDAEAASRIIARHADRLAAVILDPLPPRMGYLPAEPAFLRAVTEACRDHGILLISDEVATFRLGHGGAQGVFGYAPDLTALGKIIGGGVPVGAVAGRAEVMAVFDPSAKPVVFPHAGTFNANPLSMAAGLATMRLLDRAAFARLNALGDFARARLAAAIRAGGIAGQVTGMGSLSRMRLTDVPMRDNRTAWVHPPEKERLSRLHRSLLDAGFLVGNGGLVILSTLHDEADVEQLARAVEAGVRDLFRNSEAA